MEEGKESLEVIVRLFDKYVDLWFKNELTEYMRENNNEIKTTDIFFQFTIIKGQLVNHLIDDIKMDKVVSVSLIEHMVKEKYEEHLRGLIATLS